MHIYRVNTELIWKYSYVIVSLFKKIYMYVFIMNRWWQRKVSTLSLSQKVRSWLRDQRTTTVCYSVPYKMKHFRIFFKYKHICNWTVFISFKWNNFQWLILVKIWFKKHEQKHPKKPPKKPHTTKNPTTQKDPQTTQKTSQTKTNKKQSHKMYIHSFWLPFTMLNNIRSYTELSWL